MKMAGLCWISVLLAVSLSIGDCEPLGIGYVKRIAKLIKDKYQFNGLQFSVAVNIPENQGELDQTFADINTVIMKEQVSRGDVYQDANTVVAIPKTTKLGNNKQYTDHAEARVLDKLNYLANAHQGKILVIYSYLSPCGDKCTNEGNSFNILNKIRVNVRGTWTSYAFVFTKVFDQNPGGKVSVRDIKGTLRNLRKVMVDDNIFRCFPGQSIRCIKCFQSLKQVEPVNECVVNSG